MALKAPLGYSQNNWVGVCAAGFQKPLRYLWLESGIFRTLFMTWPNIFNVLFMTAATETVTLNIIYEGLWLMILWVMMITSTPRWTKLTKCYVSFVALSAAGNSKVPLYDSRTFSPWVCLWNLEPKISYYMIKRIEGVQRRDSTSYPILAIMSA